MRIITALYAVTLVIVFLPVHKPASAMAPPTDSQPSDTVPDDKQTTTATWSLPDDDPDQPIKRAETVAEAMAYSDDEKIVLDDVRDRDSQLNASALYILLRRSQMFPEADETLGEAESPNPKSFWREPERYRGRLVRVSVLYGGRVESWTKDVTPGRWWGRRDVWMVDVLVELEKTKPPTYDRMVVVMGHEPPKNLKKQQPLELIGLFYKLAKLREADETGDPNVKNEYPVIVAAALLQPRTDEGGFQWVGVLIILVVMIMLFVFMRLKRTVSRQRAAGFREYHPSRSDDPVSDDTAEVNEELRRQIELHQDEKRRDKDVDNT